MARQVGAAAGVATIGSVFAASFASQLRQRLAILPPATRERATASIEQAKDALATVHAGRGALAERINQSFDLAARLGFATCAAALLLAALVALVVTRRVPLAAPAAASTPAATADR